MADVGTDLNTTALIVALIALLVSSSQLVQAIFGTANGYRKCQESVMGEWSRFTHLQWRWSLFGFETIYSTPHIVIAHPLLVGRARTSENDSVSRLEKAMALSHDSLRITNFSNDLDIDRHVSIVSIQAMFEAIDNDDRVLARTKRFLQSHLLSKDQKGNANTTGSNIYQGVTWIRLLDAAKMTYEDDMIDGYLLDWRQPSPTFLFADAKQRSWDFLPLDISVPLASISLQDLIVFGHRMGLGWTSLDLAAGTLLAQGKCGSLSSRPVRGLGLVVEFHEGYTQIHHSQRSRKIITVRDVDVLAFGVVESRDLTRRIRGRLTLFYGFEAIQSDATPDATPLSNDLVGLGADADTRKWISGCIRDARKVSWEKLPSNGRILLDELLSLWMTFLPLLDHDGNAILHPLRFSAFASPLSMLEGRCAMIARLADAVRRPGGSKELELLQVILQDMRAIDELATSQSGKEPLDGSVIKRVDWVSSRSGRSAALATLAYLKSVFDATTRFFESSNADTRAADAHETPVSRTEDKFTSTALPNASRTSLHALPRLGERHLSGHQTSHLAMKLRHSTASSQKLTPLSQERSTQRYMSLLVAHMKVTGRRRHKPVDKSRPPDALLRCPPYALEAPIASAGMIRDLNVTMLDMAHGYVDDLSEVVEEVLTGPRADFWMDPLQPTDAEDEAQVRKAWWVMMLRSMVWFASVTIHPECSSFPLIGASMLEVRRTVYIA